MTNDTPAAPRNRKMILAINVPAYANIDVPDEIGDSEEALVEYAKGEFAAWWSAEDNMTLKVEWASAVRETERIVTADECDESGVSTENLLFDIDLNPPPASFEPVAGAENACRDGLVVEAYLLASTGHLTPSEKQVLAAGKAPCEHLVLSASSEYGWMLHINEALISEEADADAAFAELSEGCAGVLKKALLYGLHFVRFDADAEVIDGLPVYADQDESGEVAG
jgi:hypothetical protein